MNKPRIILTLMVLLSWITIPFVGWNHIKKYLPASLFVSFLIMIESNIAKHRKWWIFNTRMSPNVNGELPFILGPLLAGSLWILKLSYHNFVRYTLFNAISNLFFAYPVAWSLKKLNIGLLVRLKPFYFFLLMYSKAFLMYAYQKIIIDNKDSFGSFKP